ncbi:hypothetical protein ACFL1I_08590, partial [Candidatus Omnitrophota bacterium]
NARYCVYQSSKVDYFQIALKRYEQALKGGMRSAEEFEQLSEAEKFDRNRLIEDCRERIEVCQRKLNQAKSGAEIETLQRQAHNYVVAGFNYATADNRPKAKEIWEKAVRLYGEALARSEDPGAQELIRSKMQAIKHYLDYVE